MFRGIKHGDDLEDMLSRLVAVLEISDLDQVAEESRVSRQTLINWIEGRIDRPHWSAVLVVSNAVGFEG